MYRKDDIVENIIDGLEWIITDINITKIDNYLFVDFYICKYKDGNASTIYRKFKPDQIITKKEKRRKKILKIING